MELLVNLVGIYRGWEGEREREVERGGEGGRGGGGGGTLSFTGQSISTHLRGAVHANLPTHAHPNLRTHTTARTSG